jgi:hypothetical protein
MRLFIFRANSSCDMKYECVIRGCIVSLCLDRYITVEVVVICCPTGV